MAGALRVEQLAAMELAYPTYSAVVGRAARAISRQLQLIPRPADEENVEAHAAEWEFCEGSNVEAG